MFIIFKFSKSKLNFFLTLFLALISQVGYVYFNITSIEQILITFVRLLVALCFVYICSQTFGAIFYRGLQSRFTLDESICFGIFLIAFFSGFNDLYLFNVNITQGVFLFLIFVCSRTLVRTSTIFFSALMGLGLAFSSLGITHIAIYVTYGIISATLNRNNKALAPLMTFVVDLVFGYFLNAYAVYTWLNFIPIVIAGVVYVLIPNKLIEKIKGYSYSYEGSLAKDYLVNVHANLTKQKIFKISELFKNMQRTYLNLSIGEVDKKQAVDILTHQIINNHCKHCSKFNECIENAKIKSAIDNLFEFGMEKGRISMLDANNLLTSTCIQLSAMVSQTNQNLNSYFEYEKTIKTQDDSKFIVSEHLQGVSQILNELSKDIIGGQKIDERASRVVLDELTYNKVIVNECEVLISENGVDKIILVVRNKDVLSPNILPCLKTIFKMNFTITSKVMSNKSGWSIICLIPANKYNLAIGFAASGKTPDSVSGDVYGYIKLSENRYLFSIADGKGHGKEANQIATLSLSLIENFYKAGFSSNIIIDSVNRLMLASQDETFTTLDACVIDLSNATADFIKVGATVSVIKSKNQSVIVSADSLPLGIVQAVYPSIQKKILKAQDIIILASDGIVDAFDNIEEYVNFINNEQTTNVQMLADVILEEAQSRVYEHRDDMTVLIMKVNSNF